MLPTQQHVKYFSHRRLVDVAAALGFIVTLERSKRSAILDELFEEL